MRILVTGATGFLGSHLVDALLSRGHQVLAYTRRESPPRQHERLEWFPFKAGHEDAPFARGPIDAIIHVATCYGRAGETVPSLLEANLLLPVLLASLAVRFQVPLFINADTYFNRGDEGYSFLPDYSLSKHHALHWLKRCTTGTTLSLINMRLEHMYGPGDRPEKFCPHVLMAMVRHVPELPLTTGEQKRDFIYVGDVVDAFLRVLTDWKRIPGETSQIGVGWGKSTTIRDFLVCGRSVACSSTKLLFGALPSRSADFADSKADNESLRQLGWTPRVSLEEGIRLTIESLKTAAQP